MEEAIETKQLFAFLMQRQVESIMNVSEMTITSSGPAGKAKNYFSFCFLRKLATYYLQALLKFLAIGPASSKLSRDVRFTKIGGLADGRGPANTPQSKWLPAKLTPSRRPTWEGTPVGSYQCYRDGTSDFRLQAGLFQAAPSLTMLGC